MNIINKLTLRHMKLNKRRTLVTMIGIIISVAMITAVSTVGYSIMDFMARNAMESEGYFHVKFDNYRYGDNEKIVDKFNAETGQVKSYLAQQFATMLKRPNLTEEIECAITPEEKERTDLIMDILLLMMVKRIMMVIHLQFLQAHH